jgi:hypothetical protein
VVATATVPVDGVDGEPDGQVVEAPTAQLAPILLEDGGDQRGLPVGVQVVDGTVHLDQRAELGVVGERGCEEKNEKNIFYIFF